MLKKFCEYCGDSLKKENESQHSELSHKASYDPDHDEDVESFLNHFASLLDDEEDSHTASKSMDSDEEDEDEEESHKASVEEEPSFDFSEITAKLDKVASVLEDKGELKLAEALDKISDELDQYCQD